MKRMCKQFLCKERKGNYCCADCYKRQSCPIVCKNSPDRCGLAAGEGEPVKTYVPKRKPTSWPAPVETGASGLNIRLAPDRAAKYEKMAQLYAEGLNDVRIAAEAGVSRQCVINWHRRTGRKANDWRGRKRGSNHA